MGVTFKVIGLSKETGQPVEVYVFGAENDRAATDAARAHGVHPNKVGPVFNAFVPAGAQKIYLGRASGVTGQTESLEAIANCGLVQRPIRTLVLALVLAWLVTTVLTLLIAGAFAQ